MWAYVLQSGEVALHGVTGELAQDAAVRRLYLGAEGGAINVDAPEAPPATLTPGNGEEQAMSAPLLNGIHKRSLHTASARDETREHNREARQ